MVRDYFSYWLTIKHEDIIALEKAHSWLLKNGVVPDYLVPSEREPGSYSYSVGGAGSIEETGEIITAVKQLASEMPELVILLIESDEDDHAVYREHYWHDGKYAVTFDSEEPEEHLRLKAEYPERYSLVKTGRVLDDTLQALERDSAPSDKKRRVTELIANAAAGVNAILAED